MLQSAPPLLTPVPLRVKASAVAKVNPFKSNAAPEETVVPDPIVPKGEFGLVPVAPSFIVPAEMVVAPVNELSPLRVKVPVPCFVNATLVAVPF